MFEDFLQPQKVKARIRREVIELIVRNRLGTYVTGSFIIGGATPRSDIDLVVPIENSVDIRQLEQTANRFGGSIQYSSYNNGRKVIIPGCTTINILRLHPLDYAAFMFATDTLRRYPIITDRNARHRCFEELCHAYKSFINPTCVTVDATYSVYNRHVDDAYRADNIDWENFYAR